jgi:electron transfer flavoprotein alpha subunit
MADGQGILVIGELAGRELALVTREALSAARSLSEALGGEPVSLVIAGTDLGDAPQQGIAGGADTVYAVVSPVLEGTPPDAVVAVAERAAQVALPRYVIGSKTLLGRDVLPRVAFRLGTALAQDCATLEVDSQQRLVATRPVYGGSAIAKVACLHTPAVAALRPKSVEPLEPDTSRTGEVKTLAIQLDDSVVKARVVDRTERPSEGIRLEDAKVVVSGGRGLGGPEGFEPLKDLASLLGGTVGASRAVCDAGWLPSSYQVGLTGKTVTPDLYIAVGISGASQHMAGCSSARAIVAINKDAGANIFKEARFGVAGDWQKVLPAFIDQLHELLQ